MRYRAQSACSFIWPLKYPNMILWKLHDHLGKIFLDIVLTRNQKFWRKIEILMFCHNGTFWHFDMFFTAFSRTHGKLTLRTYLFGHLKEKRKEKVTPYNSFLCLNIQKLFLLLWRTLTLSGPGIDHLLCFEKCRCELQSSWQFQLWSHWSPSTVFFWLISNTF